MKVLASILVKIGSYSFSPWCKIIRLTAKVPDLIGHTSFSSACICKGGLAYNCFRKLSWVLQWLKRAEVMIHPADLHFWALRSFVGQTKILACKRSVQKFQGAILKLNIKVET